MGKYLLIYQGTTDPNWQPTPEEGEAMMKAWNDWGNKVGSSLADFGAPTGASRARVGGSGDPLSITGYTIVTADDLDGARALCDGHPFLQGAPADFSVDVYELTPM